MKFYGELLVFLLLFITNFRVFFVHHVRRDPLVCLAPITFAFALLQVFNWGVDIFNCLGFYLSLLVLLSNFHALFRYAEHLYVDHYSLLMKIWASVTCVISVIFMIAVIYYAPVELKNEKLKITETKFRFKGTFGEGFEPAKNFEKASLTVSEFSLFPDLDYRTDVVLFVPDKRADTLYYRPYLQLLAASGHTVCSADFFSPDCRWIHNFEDAKIFRRFSLVVRSVFNNQWFMAQREYYTYNISLELNQMYKFMQEKYGKECKIFIISDSMCNTACEDFIKNNPENISGYFTLDSIEDYKTPGYGTIQYSDPLMAQIIGIPKESSLSDLMITRLMVKRTAEQIIKTLPSN